MQTIISTLSTISYLFLVGCIILDVLVALLFLFRKGDNKRADYFFSIMLFVFALTSLHHLFILQKVYVVKPEWLFMPIYFTLAFGAAIFYAVKLRLFPTYKFVSSDIKHAVLPIGQFGYFLILFLCTDIAYRQALGREFYSPFYGGLEMALYIGTFYMYLFGAYRYTQFKISALRKTQEGGKPLYEAFVLRRMLRVLIILFWINSVYIVIDFAMYELLRLDMHHFWGFTRFGDLSFVAMAGWLGLSGIQLLIGLPYLNSSTLVFGFLKKILKKKKT